MDYSIDFLYDYNTSNGELIDRYLVSFINDDNELRSVEIEIADNNENTLRIIEEESDELSKDDRMLLYYILDRWCIQKFLM